MGTKSQQATGREGDLQGDEDILVILGFSDSYHGRFLFRVYDVSKYSGLPSAQR